MFSEEKKEVEATIMEVLNGHVNEGVNTTIKSHHDFDVLRHGISANKSIVIPVAAETKDDTTGKRDSIFVDVSTDGVIRYIKYCPELFETFRKIGQDNRYIVPLEHFTVLKES